MAVDVALTPVPDLPTRFVAPGDVQFGDGQQIPYRINRGGTIKERQVSLRTITYNVQGLTGDEVATLIALAETNRTAELQGINPTLNTISVSGRTYEDCFLVNVTPSGGLTIDAYETVDQTTLIYETLAYQLI